MAVVEDLKIRIPEGREEILKQAASDAEGMILDVCNRASVPSGMQNLQLALAEIYARRIMTEGENSRTEGDVSISNAYSKDIPEDLMKRILSHRKLKQAVIANET